MHAVVVGSHQSKIYENGGSAAGNVMDDETVYLYVSCVWLTDLGCVLLPGGTVAEAPVFIEC